MTINLIDVPSENRAQVLSEFLFHLEAFLAETATPEDADAGSVQ